MWLSVLNVLSLRALGDLGENRSAGTRAIVVYQLIMKDIVYLAERDTRCLEAGSFEDD